VKHYMKAILAGLGAVGTWGATAASDGFQTTEWFGLITAVVTAITVYLVPNEDTRN